MKLLTPAVLLSAPRSHLRPVKACVEDEEMCFAEVAKETFMAEAINEALLETFKSRIEEVMSNSTVSCFHKDRYGVCWHFHESEMKYLDPDTVKWIPIVHE